MYNSKNSNGSGSSGNGSRSNSSNNKQQQQPPTSRSDIYSVFPGDAWNYQPPSPSNAYPPAPYNGNGGSGNGNGSVSSSSRPANQQSSGRRKKGSRPPPIPMPRGSSNPKAIFNLPPKKIIKATGSYTSQKVGELSFRKGDFFYVIHDNPETSSYEVINPIEKTRGLVSYRFFDNVARNAAEAEESAASEQSPQQQQRSNSPQQQQEKRSSYDYWNNTATASLTRNSRQGLGSARSPGGGYGGGQQPLSPLAQESLSYNNNNSNGRYQQQGGQDDRLYQGGQNDSYTEVDEGDGYDDDFPQSEYPEDEYNDRGNGRNQQQQGGQRRYEDDRYNNNNNGQNRQGDQYEDDGEDDYYYEDDNRSEYSDYNDGQQARGYGDNYPRGAAGGKSSPLPPVPQNNFGAGNSSNVGPSRNLSTALHSPGGIRAGLDSSDVESSLVQSCNLSKDKWYFVIHVKYHSSSPSKQGRLDIIKRSYDDIWALHVTLLSRFPMESGHDGYPRSLPFLIPPSSGSNSQQSADVKLELNRYFRDLTLLPVSIIKSPYLKKFFTIRPGDLANTSMNSDVADTLLDLLEDLKDPGAEITVKLVVDDEMIAWKEAPGLSFDELIYQCEDRLGFQLAPENNGAGGLLYMDETEALTPLYGDSDLSLLISASCKLKFFVKTD